MKLSDFTGTEAVEVLADILTPATNIINDQEIRAMIKGSSTTLDIVARALKSHSDDILALYCTLNKAEPETATPVKLTQFALEVFNDEELKSLFTSQAQSVDGEHFGSATEITQDAGSGS